MSKSSWNSQLAEEDMEQVNYGYLQTSSVIPSSFNYGVELELPRINLVAQKYITYVLDFIKMTLYKHVKIAIPETISSSQNKVRSVNRSSRLIVVNPLMHKVAEMSARSP